MVEAMCSHCVLPSMRKPVSSICLTAAFATWSHTASAKHCKPATQAWLMRAMVAVARGTPNRSDISVARRFSGKNWQCSR